MSCVYTWKTYLSYKQMGYTRDICFKRLYQIYLSIRTRIFACRKMERRSGSEIIADILFEALEASTKTKILHRTNMNIGSFEKYLQTLRDRGLMECFENPKDMHPKFRTTEEGRTLLQKLREVQEIIKGRRMKPEK